MGEIAIKVEQIGKLYRLGEIGTGTISHDLNRWWARLRGKDDPFAKVGEVNDRAVKGLSEYVWALKDITFDVREGEVLGIIGRNGAGKSTLLKILSKVTTPTKGNIKVKGRIASLLEVGTGFHPELTGRENIFLNGAILGMTKFEIKSKFDEIVDFAGVERYIDTPVKRYSSGMYVRLAFAVAAFLEPEILIVDEVLAVGDAEFQKKCLGRMKDVSKNDGRTVLFVSHNLHSIAALCNKGVYLKNGSLHLYDDIGRIIHAYSNEKSIKSSRTVKIDKDGKEAWLSNFKMFPKNRTTEYIEVNSSPTIELEVESKREIKNIHIGIGINDSTDTRVVTFFSRFYDKKYHLQAGMNKIVCDIDNFCLKPDIYNVEVFIGNDSTTFDYYNKGLQIEVYPSMDDNVVFPDAGQGTLFIKQKWY